MGFRTVVVLCNDQSHEWENDPSLGRKIMLAGSMVNSGGDRITEARRFFPYGEIVEQVHADTQTLAVLDGYNGKPVAYTHWCTNQTQEQRDLALLKDLADRLGYTVSKNRSVK